MAAAVWLQRAQRVAHMVRRQGVLRTGQAVVRRLRDGPGSGHKADVLGHYNFALARVIAPAPGSVAQPRSMLWFIPDFSLGSGGHLNIFRTIWHLEQRGYHCALVIAQPQQHGDAEKARQDIVEHFFPLQAQVYLGCAGLPACEFALATGWDTAYVVRGFTGAQHKLYFVQDFEPYFYAVGSEWVLAENTYRFGFAAITAGGWLAHKLAQDYGMRTHAVGFGVEQERYRRLPRREPEIKRVFFYARPPTPRRAFELGLLVLNAVSQRLPKVEFVLAGWDTAGYQVPFPHLSCGTVALDDLPDLYSQCDVALVLSLTNLSLLPLELMACGCAVVSNRGANVEWLLDESVAVLADATPEALADAVCSLLQDDARRAALCARAEALARSQTWDAVAQQFEAGLQRLPCAPAEDQAGEKGAVCAV